MAHQLNREMWNHFLEQIDAQVEGDFFALASEYEAIMGRPFHVSHSPRAMFSMVQQAMMTENKQLLISTVAFITLLPERLQTEFSLYSRHHVDDKKGVLSRKKQKRHVHHKAPIASRLWNFLHLKRAA